jgi:hypothetical protein
MKKFLPLALLSLVFFTGCKKEKSQDVNPDNIIQEEWYIYDADNNDSYFSIRFYDTDWYKRVLLAPPASVTLNGNIMKLNEVNSFYELNYDNEQLPSGVFVYTDALNRIYTNTAYLEKSIDLPVIDTLYTRKDNVISWIGDPCSGSSEIITFHVGFILPLATVTTSQAGATSITVKAGALGSSVGEGLTRMRIERQTTSSLQQGTQMGGKIVTRYKSRIKWVYVK